MSILSSTNSGGQKVLTVQDLLGRGWYFKSISALSRITSTYLSSPSVVNTTKMYFKNNDCWLDITYKNGEEISLQFFWTYEHEITHGKRYKITKTVKLFTLLDLCKLEKVLEIEDHQEKLWKLEELYSGFYKYNFTTY